ncbi:2Fe-2S iron-sulfur cluster-binding protein [Zavarzinia sp. CC-PAN008]|uniref:2Fe-2S iron-sulfur cluster-binding protein n=1 Tax=Zavarzinia sp. CC-PAN008 TaxID=3243332 RepID=UPI003F74AAF0
MAKITFIDHKGTSRTVDAAPGVSVMEAAIRNMVPGIDADCGGACACATCHVYVDEAWLPLVGKPEAAEAGMLEFAQNVNHTSRLSCQIKLSDALDGLIVTTPESQF